MKINVHTKFTKEKIAKSKSRFKTKLTSRKTQKKKMRAACKNTRENTTVKLANDTFTNDIQNISLAGETASLGEKTAAQGSLKRKKEPSDSEEIVDKMSPAHCLKQNDFIEWERETNGETDDDWKLDNSKDEKQEDDDWTHIVPKEKRNLGSPVVVDTTRLSNSVASTSLPKIFEREQRIRSEKSYDDAFELNALFSKQVCMTNGQLNHKHSRAQRKHLKEASPMPSNEDDRNKNTGDDKLEDLSNLSSPIKSPMRKKIVKNRSPRSVDRSSSKIIEDESSSSIDRNSDAEASSSSRHENVSSRQHKRNQKQPAVYAIENIVIVIMESGSRLCFTGKLLVKVLYGAIKVYGSILNKSSGTTEVYSPRGYSNVVIETNEEFPKDSIDDAWTALAAWGIPDQLTSKKTKLTKNMANVQPGTAVFVLQNFENNLTFFLKTYFPYIRLFPNVKNPCHFSWTDPRRAEIILQANLHFEQYDDFNHRRLIIDPHITMDIAERMLSSWRANEWTCTLIAGGKSVGKSTSIRCLINSLLRTSEKVVLIDVDPGQAECTPPGCISYSLIEEPLLGPNFTHLKTPVYQLFIDDVNVSRCVTRYLEGIKMLIEKLKECPVLSRLPIVVNTMGFTQNLGWDIAIFTIKLVRPSIILQIMSSKKKNNYDDFLSAEVVNKQECTWTFCDERFIDWTKPCQHDLCIIYSHAETVTARTNEWNMEPYQQRELVMMSYLSGIVCDKNDPLQYYTGLSVSINEAAPYSAPFSSLCIIPQRLFGVPASRALSVINGNIVALCGIDLTEESSQKSTDISSLRVLTQRSPLCTCYGFGIVRGVDMDQQKVFINTPLSISMMQYINCLAGCIPVPPALLQLHQGAPYVGEKAALPTSREPRKGYFRMRYSNKLSKS